MYSAYHDHNAADWHDRDFDRFRRDEARRRAVLSDLETLSVTPTQTAMPRPPSATPPLPHQATFEKDLSRLINHYSQENGSDTPDFILAEYLKGCLRNFNITLQAREKWYGREIHIKGPSNVPSDGTNDPLPSTNQ